jgi:pimeloyl-ACP methyl ester carboxylesterase
MAVAATLLQDDEGRRLPYGRRVELRGRGTTFVREAAGPAGAPTLLLLHGWGASGALNWYRSFGPLAERFNVVAPDLRGHARGLRSRKIFRLADCADDCAETLVALDTGPVIAVGYSMGGPIAQLMWRRHRDLVAGLVLCATTAGFFPQRAPRLAYQAGMLTLAGAARAFAQTPLSATLPPLPLPTSALPIWAAAEMRRHDYRMLVEAGQSLSTYHAPWIGEVDVPTTVVCTTNDVGVAPALQLETAAAIRGATVHCVDDGHFACAHSSFAFPLRGACLDVAARVR